MCFIAGNKPKFLSCKCDLAGAWTKRCFRQSYVIFFELAGRRLELHYLNCLLKSVCEPRRIQAKVRCTVKHNRLLFCCHSLVDNGFKTGVVIIHSRVSRVLRSWDWRRKKGSLASFCFLLVSAWLRKPRRLLITASLNHLFGKTLGLWFPIKTQFTQLSSGFAAVSMGNTTLESSRRLKTDAFCLFGHLCIICGINKWMFVQLALIKHKAKKEQ